MSLNQRMVQAKQVKENPKAGAAAAVSSGAVPTDLSESKPEAKANRDTPTEESGGSHSQPGPATLGTCASSGKALPPAEEKDVDQPATAAGSDAAVESTACRGSTEPLLAEGAAASGGAAGAIEAGSTAAVDGAPAAAGDAAGGAQEAGPEKRLQGIWPDLLMATNCDQAAWYCLVPLLKNPDKPSEVRANKDKILWPRKGGR